MARRLTLICFASLLWYSNFGLSTHVWLCGVQTSWTIMQRTEMFSATTQHKFSGATIPHINIQKWFPKMAFFVNQGNHTVRLSSHEFAKCWWDRYIRTQDTYCTSVDNLNLVKWITVHYGLLLRLLLFCVLIFIFTTSNSSKWACYFRLRHWWRREDAYY